MGARVAEHLFSPKGRAAGSPAAMKADPGADPGPAAAAMGCAWQSGVLRSEPSAFPRCPCYVVPGGLANAAGQQDSAVM